MEHRTFRIENIEEPSDVWFRFTLDPQRLYIYTLLGSFSISRLGLTRNCIRFGGIACMLGGVLWMMLFLLAQLDWYWYWDLPYLYLDTSSEVRWVVTNLLSYASERLLIIPMLLFMVGLVGMYARQVDVSTTLARLGVFICFTGLTITILFFVPYFFYGGYFLYLYVNNYINDWIWSPLYWLPISYPIVSIGLLLFGIALLRARVLPTKALILLVVSSFLITLMMITLPLFEPIFGYVILNIFGDSYSNLEDWVNRLGIFTVANFLFGVAWVWLGRALWSEGSQP